MAGQGWAPLGRRPDTALSGAWEVGPGKGGLDGSLSHGLARCCRSASRAVEGPACSGSGSDQG